MGSAHVLKIKYGGVVRRLTLTHVNERLFSYVHSAARNLFGLPATAPAAFTYEDEHGDAIALVDDKDLDDALVLGALNPLRITMIGGDLVTDARVGKEESGRNENEESAKALEHHLVLKFVEDGDAGGKGREIELGKMKTVCTSKDGTAKGSNAHRDSQGDALSMTLITESSNVHRETRCQACRMTPITGPLFRVQLNQILCTSCSSTACGMLYNALYKGDADHATQCRRCGETVPSGVPFFTICLQEDLCLSCFDEQTNEADRACYMKIQQNFYRLARPTFDVKIHAAAFSLEGSGGSDRREDDTRDDTSNASRQTVHLGVQCDECGMEPIRGPRFRRYNGVKCNLCLPCFKRKGSDDTQYCLDSSSATEGYFAIGNQINPLAPSRYMPGYICKCCVSLLDPWTISVRETFKPLKADSRCPQCIGDGKGKTKAKVVAVNLSGKDWFESEEAENLSAEPTIMYISDNHSEVSFGYVVRSCNDIHRL